MKLKGIYIKVCLSALLITFFAAGTPAQVMPDDLTFVRQGVKRMIFDEDQSIVLSKLEPCKVIDLQTMHPVWHHNDSHAEVQISSNILTVKSELPTETSIWFGGFNPFATYSAEIVSCTGTGAVGFEFADSQRENQFIVTTSFNDNNLKDVFLEIKNKQVIVAEESVSVNLTDGEKLTGKIILQMLGSGFVMYLQDDNNSLPKVIAQSDFNEHLDLRDKQLMQSFHSHLYVTHYGGEASVKEAEMALTTGVGQADIRAITYENGEPLLDMGRLWYTMSIRGRALPHHIQGVFSMNPTLFDVRLEGVILFDRKDGILRNEIASHIFYDRNEQLWRGVTTGFSAFARPDSEKKQLLAVESKHDPRLGFSVMDAEPFGLRGDIEDPHIIFDQEVNKWRILTCTNKNGYKAIMLESDYWNKGYRLIAGPVNNNSTGTSIQKIGDTRYCFSGSSDRKIYIYTYPALQEAGTLLMDLPPWDEESGTRVWPNIVQLPDGFTVKYVALMFDRHNYPGMSGPNWTYGALYKYNGMVNTDIIDPK